MRALILHWGHSTRYMASRPAAWLVLLAGAVVAITNISHYVYEGLAAKPVDKVLLYAAGMTAPLLWLVLLGAVLPSASRIPTRDWREPLSALPIGERSRALAEVLAAFALAWPLRAAWPLLSFFWWAPRTATEKWLFYAAVLGPPLLLLALAACVPPLKRRWTYWCLALVIGALAAACATTQLPLFSWWLWLRSGVGSLLTGDLILGLPILVAIASSRRVRWAYVGRIASAYLLTFVLVAMGLREGLRPATLYLLALALALVVLATMGHEPSWLPVLPGTASTPSLRPRVASSPGRRLVLDGSRRSLALFAAVILPGLVCLTLGPALYRSAQHPGWLLLVALGIYAIAVAAFYPLGLPLIGDPPQLFPSAYCVSWSWLPVRAEWVRRTAYAYGLLMGVSMVAAVGIFWLKGRLYTLLSRLPEVSAETWLVLGLIILGWAGFTLAAAAGDRSRSIATAAGLVLSIIGMLLSLRYGHQSTQLVILGGAALAAFLPLPLLRGTARA